MTDIYNLLRFVGDETGDKPHYFARRILDHALEMNQLVFFTKHMVWRDSWENMLQEIDIPKLAKWIEGAYESLGITAEPLVMADVEGEYWEPWSWTADWKIEVNLAAMGRQIRLIKELRRALPGNYRFGMWGRLPPIQGGSLYSNGPNYEARFWELAHELKPLAEALGKNGVTFPPVYLHSKAHKQYIPLERVRLFVQQIIAMSHSIYKLPCLPVAWMEKYDVWKVHQASGVDNREKQLERQWDGEYYRGIVEECRRKDGGVLWSQPAVDDTPPVWHWEDDWVNGLLPALGRSVQTTKREIAK